MREHDVMSQKDFLVIIIDLQTKTVLRNYQMAYYRL